MSRPSPEQLLHGVPAYAGASLRPFRQGSANALFHIEPSEPRALLRVHDSGARMGVDRDLERRIWRRADAAALSPALLHWDPDHRFSIAELWGERARQLCPRQAVGVLVRFHTLSCPVGTLDYAANLAGQGESPGRWQRQMLASGIPAGMTHHDPSRGNWLVGDGGVRLIDFEYAGYGHPLWDLACLMLEWPQMEDAAGLYYRLRQTEFTPSERVALLGAGQLYLHTCLAWCLEALRAGGDAELLTQWRRRYAELLAEGGLESLL